VLDFKALFKYIEGRPNNQFSKRRANIMAAQKFRTWKLYFIEPSVVAPNAVVNSESELSSIRQRFLTKKGDKS
jgi:hypothetical protein